MTDIPERGANWKQAGMFIDRGGLSSGQTTMSVC